MSIWTWIAGIFKSVKDDADKIAISITEGVKAALSSGVVSALASIIDKAFNTQIAAEAVVLLNTAIPKVLAVELAIQGLPDSPTPADIQTFENNVIQAVSGLTPTTASKLYTTLAAQVYGIIETDINKKTPVTFAELVSAVEQAYQDYISDEANSADTAS